MNLTDKEKRVAIAGCAAVALACILTFVIVPLAREWVRLGKVLGPKQHYVKTLQDRLRRQDALLARRQVLRRELGSVLGPEADAPPKEPNKNEGASVVPKEGNEPPGENGKPDAEAPKGGNSHVERSKANRFTNTALDKNADAGETVSGNPKEKEPVADEPIVAPVGISLATHLERTAKQSKVPITRMVAHKPAVALKDSKYLVPVGVRLTFEANIEVLVNFLHALEKGQRLMRIEQMDLRRDEKRGPNIGVTLHVMGYEGAAR